MPMPLLSPLTTADLDAVMALERQCFEEPWTRHMYISDLTNNTLATYLALRPPAEAIGQRVPRPCVERKEAASAAWSAAEIEAAAADPAADMVILPPLLGWGGFWLMVDEAHIATVASHPEWRGCGLGQWLMVALMDAAQERGARLITLEVRAGNLPAQQLYLKLGFEITGRRRRYYRDGEDGLIMTTPALTDPALQARLAAARADALQRAVKCFSET